MTRRVFHYSGDVNIEYGGMFYCLDTWKDNYVDAVRVTACSDAGGPDNCFWVDRLTINIPAPEPDDCPRGFTREQREAHRILHDRQHPQGKLGQALASCGWYDPEQRETWEKMTPAQRRHVIVDVLVGYGSYVADSTMVQIGKVQRLGNGDRFEPDTVLHSRTSLRRYAREQCSS